METAAGPGMVLSELSTITASTLTNCTQGMANSVLLNMSAPHGSITVENCTIDQSGGVPRIPGNCGETAVRSATQHLPTQVKALLSEMVVARPEFEDDKAELLSMVSQAFTASSVASCGAMAINQARLNLYTTQGNIVVDCRGGGFTQDAEAAVLRCVNSLDVQGTSLAFLLQSRICDSGKYLGVRPRGGGAIVGGAQACGNAALYRYAAIGVAVVAAVLVCIAMYRRVAGS